MHVFGLQEEVGVCRENPRKPGENIQTPTSYEATMLTNKLPFCLAFGSDLLILNDLLAILHTNVASGFDKYTL